MKAQVRLQTLINGLPSDEDLFFVASIEANKISGREIEVVHDGGVVTFRDAGHYFRFAECQATKGEVVSPYGRIDVDIYTSNIVVTPTSWLIEYQVGENQARMELTIGGEL